MVYTVNMIYERVKPGNGPRCRAIAAVCLAGFFAVVSAGAQTPSSDVWRDVALYRDEWGVPHVYADNPFALAYAFGYAQAEDHAEHLLLAYRMANGRLAAVLGESYADSDVFSLKMGHGRLARELLPTLDPITQALCEGFAMGVNAWLIEHPGALPDWADGVQPGDVLALWHAFVMSMAPFDLPDANRRPPAMVSGNAWAMAPGRSADGRAALVINPHQHYDGFFQWCEAHLVMGEMNVYGAALRGLPVVVQGHNEALGWALTPNWSDFADMFTEEYEGAPSNPKDPRVRNGEESAPNALLLHYMAHSLPYHVRTEAGVETRYAPAYIGDRGPIFEHPTLGLHSWFIGGYNDLGGLRQLFDMGCAATLDAFMAALELRQIPCFHVIYADRDGNIFYLYNTKAGVRLEPAVSDDPTQAPLFAQPWDEPVSHELAAVAWRDVLPLADLPFLLNPASGFVQACGNPPWTAGGNDSLASDRWPPWLVQDVDGYRAKRVRQLLQQGQRSFRDHQSMLYDVVVPAAFDLMPALLRAAEARTDLTQSAHPDFQLGLDVLRAWNCIAETPSSGMTFFHVWWSFARARAAASFPSETAFQIAAVQGDPTAQEIMLRAVEETARTLRNEYDSLERPWGEVHRIQRGSRDEPIPGAGSGEPIFLASDHLYDRGRWSASYGYGFAMVVQFGEKPESVSVLPFGASQNPESPHFDDQLDLMLERRFKHVRFDHDDVLRSAERAMGMVITLLPPGVPGAVTAHADAVIQARLNSVVEAPASLPRDMIPFSLYMQLERTPSSAPLMTEWSIHVPELLCDEAAFSQLALCRYEPGLNWQPLNMQQADPTARILFGRDDAPDGWYAVLGPADAAGRQRYSGGVPGENDAEAGEGLVGLDALLTEHTAQPIIAGRGRIFRMERHDDDAPPELATEAPPTPESTPGRTFRFERLDQGAPKDQPRPASSMAGIPGFHFGPGTRESDEHREAPQGRIFKIERHDQGPGASKSQAATEDAVPQSDVQEENHPQAAAPQAKISDKDLSSDAAVQAEAPDYIDPKDVAQDQPPQQSEQHPVQDASPPSALPLPEVIPQDPNFIFGPARQRGVPEAPRSGPSRVFHIERLDQKPPE